MPPRTRLDSVVRLRERDELHAKLQVADRARAVQAAVAALQTANDRAANDHREAATAEHWQVAELAHQRALVDVKNAQKSLESARAGETAARAAALTAHQRTEAVSRARDRKIEELDKARIAGERKEIDQIALLLRAS